MKSARGLFASLLILSACGGGGGPDLVGAPGVNLEEVAIYQGVKRTLHGGDGTATQSVPIVSGRDALIRVFAVGDETYNREPVLARLTLATPTGEPVVLEEAVPSLPLRVTESDLNSTINFFVPGDVITPDTHFRLDLLQESDTAASDNPAAYLPMERTQALTLGASAATAPLEIVLVPIVNNGRTPDVSAEQVERYRAGFMSQYPATDVIMTVREPVEWPSSVTPDGGGWSSLLNSMSDLRSQDRAASHVYYYGIFTPVSSIGEYCSGGCTLGLGFLPGVSDSFMRVAIGLGYTGQSSVDTAIHEVGHNHGREHSPCGVSGADPQYPNRDGSIGTWGLSPETRELKSPFFYTDFMGYCADIWVSDYTYRALYDRMRAIDGLRSAGSPKTYGRVHIGPEGVEPLSPITVDSPMTFNRSFVARGEDGSRIEGQGRFFPYDHIEGGVLLVPDDFRGLRITEVEGLKLAR